MKYNNVECNIIFIITKITLYCIIRLHIQLLSLISKEYCDKFYAGNFDKSKQNIE